MDKPETDTPPRNNGLQNLIDLLEAKVDDESITPAEMRVLADLYHRNGIELGLQIKASAPVPNLLPFGDVKEVNG
jgi:hypothetical protein